MSRAPEAEAATQSHQEAFGQPWPDLNDGLFYSDVVSASDSSLFYTSSDFFAFFNSACFENWLGLFVFVLITGLTLIEFYSTKHKNSAPLQGWVHFIVIFFIIHALFGCWENWRKCNRFYIYLNEFGWYELVAFYWHLYGTDWSYWNRNCVCPVFFATKQAITWIAFFSFIYLLITSFTNNWAVGCREFKMDR